MEKINGKDADWIYTQIAEGNGEEALSAAKDILNSSEDTELRTDITVLLTEYQTAKESGAMMVAYDKTVSYVKNQMALLMVQAFRMGQVHQRKVDNEAFKEILNKASEMNKEAIEEVTKK